MAPVIEVSSPATAIPGEMFFVSGIVYESTTGDPYPETSVGCHYDGAAFGSDVTDIDGIFEIRGSIPRAGKYTIRANARGVIGSTTITITERAFVVTISAPITAVKGETFLVSGTVYEDGGPVVGTSVGCHYDGAAFGSGTTDVNGRYEITGSIPTALTYTLRANARGKIVSTTITIIEAAPPPPPLPPPPTLYEVRFACIPIVEGVKCTLDGEFQYSNEIGIASFFNVTSGRHSYSVEKEGMRVVSGQDPWRRPLAESGTTVIEVPGAPKAEWPTNKPWLLSFTFEEIIPIVPPEEPPTVLPIVAGHIWHIEYWYKGLDAWRNLETDFVPPKVGTEISFGPRWINDGNIALTGHVNIEITSPTGVKYTPYATLNQDLRTGPRSGFGVQFEPLLIDEAGEWGIKVVLNVEGSPSIIADEKEYTFSVEALPPGILPPDVPPAVPPVLPPLLPPAVVPPAVPGIPPVIPTVPGIPPEWKPVTDRLNMLLWIILDINEEIKPIAIKANSYSILNLDLSTAHLADQTHYLSGFAITVLRCTGTLELRIGDITTDSITIDPLIYPQTIIIDMMDFTKIFSRNAAQVGMDALLIIWRRE